MYLFVCIVCTYQCVEGLLCKGQLSRVSSFHQEGPRDNSGPQAGQQAPLLTEPRGWPLTSIFQLCE